MPMKACLPVAVAFAYGGAFAGDFTAKVTWETLPQFCASNVGLVTGKPRGFWIEHHGLGCRQLAPDQTGERAIAA